MFKAKRNVKNFAALLLIAVMAVTLIGCTGDEAEEYEGAITHVSGTVMIYTSMFEDIIEIMIPAMERVFPNVDVQFFYGGTGMIQARIASEIVAGQLGADMLMVADPSYAIELQSLGMLHSFETPARPHLAFEYCPEGTWYPVRISNMVLAYNPELYSRDEIPTSMFDFAFDSRVQGAISKANPLTSGTALVSIVALYGAYGEDYFAGLGNQNVMVESGAVARTKLQTGECMVIMILEESILQARENDGSELTIIYPDDGTIVIPSPIMLINDEWNANQNNEAAEAIANWFLSMDGQEYIVRGWMHSARSDFPRAPFDAMPTAQIRQNTIPVDWNRAAFYRDWYRERFLDNVMIPE